MRLFTFVHTPPFLQGSGEHGFASPLQSLPSHPFAHAHENSTLLTFVQTPLFKQGFGEHGSASFWQFFPIHPATHVHL